MPAFLIVTGTDTGVGKTIVTAAIAACALSKGLKVAVVKPAQTGDDSDEETVRHLAGPHTVTTLMSYPDPLAPLAAARVSGMRPIALQEVVEMAGRLTEDLVLIEGAGGLLVPMGPGWTIADLALELKAPAVVVTRPALGTLNHTALTLEALERRTIPALLVLGSWPTEPELVHRTNLEDFQVPLEGVVPQGAGRMDPAEFRSRAIGWLSPTLYGDRSAPAPRRQ